jgi:4-diphosphocytidyl-2-C-methyl-D-erythritol kinase
MYLNQVRHARLSILNTSIEVTHLESITEKSRAKINLSLDILGVLPNGYHEVEMIMQQIDLYDLVTVTKIDSGIEVTSNLYYLPTDQSNIAWKAARLLMDQCNIESGVKIHLEKKVPVAAGLAGGSANAAAVMRAMNKLFDLGLSTQAMMDLGLTLGADVPFCFLEGAAVARGIGEQLEPIKGLQNIWVLLSKPNIGVSTREIYKAFDQHEMNRHPNTPLLIEATGQSDLTCLTGEMYNVLEDVTRSLYPMVSEVRRRMHQSGAQAVMMSGSGPTVFGLFTHYERAHKAEKQLRKWYQQTYLVKTYGGGSL